MNTNVASSLEDTVNKEVHSNERNEENLSGVERSLAAQDTSVKRPVKVCRVCGDRAIGFNFGVITCESCKTFFRRNFARIEEFVCQYDNNCPTTVACRKLCQKCRLRKCYTVGMSMETISKRRIYSAGYMNNTSETTVANDGQSLRCSYQSGEKWTSRAAPDCGQESHTDKVHVVFDGNTNNMKTAIRVPKVASTGRLDHCDIAGRIISAIVEVVQSRLGEIAQQQDAEFGSSTSGGKDITPTWVGREYEADWSNEKRNSILCHSSNMRQRNVNIDDGEWWSSKTEFEDGNNQSVPFRYTPPNDSRHSSSFCDMDYFDAPLIFPSVIPLEEKYVKLEQLLIAHREWDRINSCPPLEGSDANMTPPDHHKIAYFCMSQAAKEEKILTTFAKLDRCDQLTLLKILTRLSIKHNMETNKTTIGHPGCPQLPIESAKAAGKDFYTECLKLKLMYPEKFRSNDTILAILCAIALFNPGSPRLINRHVIEEERQLYLQLFKEYLESTFGQVEGRWAYRYLVTWLTSVCLCSKLQAHLLSYDIDPSTLGISDLLLKPMKED